MLAWCQGRVSCIAAKSLWIAGFCGLTSSAALYCCAGAIVGALNPPEAAVAAFAVDYIRIRCLGIPLVLLGFVCTGVFRGFKDTRTPLVGAVLSAAVSLGLNYLLLYVMQLGVVGSAIAITAAQAVSCCLLLTALLSGGKVFPRHLTSPPPLSATLPTLKLGAVLGTRNVISFGMVLYASALSIRMGSAHQASFEVIRQVWILTIQFFECLNVAAQALLASYLGKEPVL
ncbi:MATE efflux family protein 1 [Tetrabaena socialis]|uniref:MATE efflux family protein 1 n=1 Tax=Tetrabaena socialis TaxID=47790 RepID=A0A2J8ABR5_9CHLO|nr:MATE efflux family protein 1 [Tetrabaena socialis]|eukprot:PNH09968.1 MATE efflux family protein 1 [Tetrabaena socialis]